MCHAATTAVALERLTVKASRRFATPDELASPLLGRWGIMAT